GRAQAPQHDLPQGLSAEECGAIVPVEPIDQCQGSGASWRNERARRDRITACRAGARGGAAMEQPTPQDSHPTNRAPEIRVPYQVLLSVAAGAGLMYFLDPESGKRRRTMWRDRSGAIVRRTTRRVERIGQVTASEAYGLKQKVTHLRPAETKVANDADLV